MLTQPASEKVRILQVNGNDTGSVIGAIISSTNLIQQIILKA